MEKRQKAYMEGLGRKGNKAGVKLKMKRMGRKERER